uniref:Uncharacterized protein n=1 Tax=Anguilla anguilla TaxID=7936 RepID=A0A0E9SBX1_ANGAN
MIKCFRIMALWFPVPTPTRLHLPIMHVIQHKPV